MFFVLSNESILIIKHIELYIDSVLFVHKTLFESSFRDSGSLNKFTVPLQ